MARLIRFTHVERHKEIPWTRKTLYKFRHTRRFPSLFVKVGGTCFVDLDELEKILEAGRGK